MMIFAPFGNTDYFYEQGNKSALEMPEFLSKIGLNGYEYSLEEGIHISTDACELLKSEADKYNIMLSVYSGKFTSLEKSVELAEKIGSERVIFPLGSCAVVSRKKIYEKTLFEIKKALKNSKNVRIYPESAGLIHDFGDFSELLKLSREDERIIPALNFPQLFARNLGQRLDFNDCVYLFEKAVNELGKERANMLHIYLADADFTNQGFKSYEDFSDKTEREKKSDNGEHFDFRPVIKAIKKLKIEPFIVCRSPYLCYTQATEIKKYYEMTEETEI